MNLIDQLPENPHSLDSGKVSFDSDTNRVSYIMSGMPDRVSTRHGEVSNDLKTEAVAQHTLDARMRHDYW